MKAEFEKIFGPEAHARVKPFYQNHFGRSNVGDNDLFFTATIGQELVAVVRFCIEEGTPLLRSMLVAPAFQRKGVGQKILNTFEAYLNENQVRNTSCIAYEHLEEFYGNIGFVKQPISSAPIFLQNRIKEYEKIETHKIIFMVRK